MKTRESKGKRKRKREREKERELFGDKLRRKEKEKVIIKDVCILFAIRGEKRESTVDVSRVSTF